ncbi:hypothetical protein JW949_03605 [Candidatus Woesearchaeota archaeon]|nr:hypothetical protein [Candidatus Woesearchaeota archaeon]
MDEEKKKKYLQDLRNREYDEWFPFECIIRRLFFLKQFAKIIDNHPEELDPSYKSVIKERGIRPSEPLMDFFILDIRNFYWIAYKKFEDTIEYPDSWKYIKELRDNTIAHFTKDAPKEVVMAYEKIQEIGFNKIWNDFCKFRESVKSKIKSKKL